MVLLFLLSFGLYQLAQFMANRFSVRIDGEVVVQGWSVTLILLGLWLLFVALVFGVSDYLNESHPR